MSVGTHEGVEGRIRRATADDDVLPEDGTVVRVGRLGDLDSAPIMTMNG
jgi:hypothetical protein